MLALDFMHKRGILHRDIKPGNILVVNAENLHVCITDLGMACRESDALQVGMVCGTPGYIAPEILKKKVFTNKADIFSLGSILFNLVTLRPLFHGSTPKEVILANREQNPKLSVRLFATNVSAECRSLLYLMLDPNPTLRVDPEACLNHSWFQQDHAALQELLFLNKN